MSSARRLELDSEFEAAEEELESDSKSDELDDDGMDSSEHGGSTLGSNASELLESYRILEEERARDGQPKPESTSSTYCWSN